jgi:AcrR family transcriptional regulator
VPRTRAGGKPSRVYRSAQRTAQARDTRQRIVAAATEQFASAGYPVTTMRSVAAAAGVSVASIELAFGTKAQLLKTAIDVAIAGDHDPVAVLDRDWATAAQATTTVHEFLAAVARILRPAMIRSAGLVLAAYNAAGTDPAPGRQPPPRPPPPPPTPRWASSPSGSPPSAPPPWPGSLTASATAPPSARDSPGATRSTRYGCSWTPPSTTS